MDDLERVVQEAVAGDSKSFNCLVGKYWALAQGLAYHWTKSVPDAQDIVQESFYLAFEHLAELRDANRFPSWLQRIVTNQCKRWARKRQSSISIDAAAGSFHTNLDPLPDELLEQRENQAAVAAILCRLPEKQQLALTLFYLDDLSYQEVSDLLEVPVSTVKGRLHKARKHLKKEALAMVEDVLGSHPNRPHFEVEKVYGYVCLENDGTARLRPTAESPASADDVVISATNVSLHELQQGDFVVCHAVLGMEGGGLRGVIRFEQINAKPAVETKTPSAAAPGQTRAVTEAKRQAREAARRLQNGYIGTEHLLLGLLQARDSRACGILRSLGVEIDSFKSDMETWFSGDVSKTVEEETELTPRSKEVLTAATAEAEALSAAATEPEHLLLALARDRNGAAAQALWKAGVDAAAVIDQLT